jgi:hypothetical protein
MYVRPERGAEDGDMYELGMKVAIDRSIWLAKACRRKIESLHHPMGLPPCLRLSTCKKYASV